MNAITNELAATEQHEAVIGDVKHYVLVKDAEGNDVRVEVEGPTSTVQDKEFSDDARGN